MKSNFFRMMMLFVSIATLTLTSCSKDPEDLILGEWSTDNIKVTMNMEGQQMGMDISKLVETITFNEGGAITIIGHEAEMTDMGGFEFSPETITMNGSWLIDESGNSMTIIIDDEPQAFNIVSLEKKELKLSVSEEIDVDFTVTIEANFVK